MGLGNEAETKFPNAVVSVVPVLVEQSTENGNLAVTVLQDAIHG